LINVMLCLRCPSCSSFKLDGGSGHCGSGVDAIRHSPFVIYA
jgi:hypothetical protein